jgi:hypothetical protein
MSPLFNATAARAPSTLPFTAAGPGGESAAPDIAGIGSAVVELDGDGSATPETASGGSALFEPAGGGSAPPDLIAAVAIAVAPTIVLAIAAAMYAVVAKDEGEGGGREGGIWQGEEGGRTYWWGRRVRCGGDRAFLLI